MVWRAWVLGGLLVSGCARAVPLARVEPPPPPTPAMIEQDVRPIELPHVRIVDLEQTPSADRKHVTLRGILRNEGDGPTRQLYVEIEGRDVADAVVFSTEASPASDEIPAGGTGTFTVTVDNHPDVVRYRVQAISR